MRINTNVDINVYAVALLYDMYDDGSRIESNVFTNPISAMEYANSLIRSFAHDHNIIPEEHDWDGSTQFKLSKLDDTVMCEDDIMNRLFVKITTVVL